MPNPSDPAAQAARTPHARSPNVLEVSDARRSYAGGPPALDGLSLEVRAGEILALLGPNGAGKTSLIRAICGRVRLDSGTLSLGGRDPRRDPQARRQLGLVPQEVALYPELTARENLELLARLAGLAPAAAGRAAREALEWIGLAERAHSRARELSSGMKRRLNLAAGVLHRPHLLLLDEPTVGVDAAARERIHDGLRELRAQGMAILLATHDFEQAEALADRIAILSRGHVRGQGTLAALVQQVFGGARELVVTLAHEPDAPARSALEAEGLAAVEPLTWRGRLAGDLTQLDALALRLAASGLLLNELRVREPGLGGVFQRLVCDEPGA